MVAFLIVLLIISQLISFYFIILLNTKVSKFKELEVRQDQLIREMDDAISVYLMEMREENNRLIQELTKAKSKNGQQPMQPINNEQIVGSPEVEKQKVQKETQENEIALTPKIAVPKSIVKNAYNRQKTQPANAETVGNQPHKEERDKGSLDRQSSDESEKSFEQQVIKLHHDGKSIEEIAKITQKGKTEIELLLKFHV
ncbi:hypothetical protein QUF56_05870 [Ureibacillus composti]|nr:hypothetical protein [Ureibacillus composti]